MNYSMDVTDIMKGIFNLTIAVQETELDFNHTMAIIAKCKIAFYSLFSVLVAFMNLLTIIAVSRYEYLQRSTFIYILSLSVADFLLFPPLAGLPYIHQVNDDTTVVALNVVLLSLLGLSLSMSLMSLLAIAVDRYQAVLTPFTYKSTMTVARARKVVVFIWIYGIITMIPTVTYFTIKKGASFLRENQEIAMIVKKEVFLVLMAAQSALYVCISIILYIRVFLKLRRRAIKQSSLHGFNLDENKKSTVGSESKRTTIMMGIVLSAIVITWLPFNIVSLVLTCMDKDMHQKSAAAIAKNVTLLILYTNSFLNPMICAWLSPLFRRAYFHILTCGRVDTKKEKTSFHQLST